MEDPRPPKNKAVHFWLIPGKGGFQPNYFQIPARVRRAHHGDFIKSKFLAPAGRRFNIMHCVILLSGKQNGFKPETP
jgi:hypothetical protein